MEKMVLRTVDALSSLCETTVTEVEDPNADVNHWAHYLDLWRERMDRPGSGKAKTSFWVTHVDDPLKLKIVRRLCAAGNAAICLSSDLASALDAEQVRSELVSWALPGCDGGRVPPKIAIGLATRLYDDGRKNEWMLLKLCSEFGPDHLEFRIWGDGWQPVIAKMRGLGVEVKYGEGASYEALLDGLAECDYYLYCGMDEGSLGTLDAMKAGVRTIVTDQGFHRDLSTAIDHLFSTYDELRAIVGQLIAGRIRRLEALDATSWNNYARHNLEIWNHLVKEGVCPPRTTQQPGKAPFKVGGSWLMALRTDSFRRYYGLWRLRSWVRKHLSGSGLV